MGLSAGPGSPIFFHCPVARRNRDYPSGRLPKGHTVKLTGRTKPYRAKSYSAMGQRSTSTLREFRCSCGHVGWSNHADLERMEKDS